MELHGGNILNVRWCNIYVDSLNGIRTVSSKENCPTPLLGLGLRLGLVLGVSKGGNFPWGQLSQNFFEYIKNKWKDTLNVDASCTYRRTFEY